MKVSELAKQLDIKVDEILTILRSMKLKSKDGKQELSEVVVSVVKSAVSKSKGLSKETKAPAKKAKAAPKKAVKKVVKAKKAVKPKKEAASKKETVVKKKTVKKDVKVKKVAVSSKSKPRKESVVKVKKVLKKSTVAPEAPKVIKKKISREPMITLRPLGRKKRKPTGKDADASKGEELDPNVAAPVLDEAGVASSAVSKKPEEGEQEVEEVKVNLPDYDDSLPEIEIKVPITVKDFSIKIQQKPSVVLKSLMKKGMLTHINQFLGEEVVAKLTLEFGYNLTKIKTQEQQVVDFHRQEEDDPKLLKSRAPVITFMGHVDHGKTSLVDCIRKTKVADKEHGGITQHMGAYSVKLPKGRITFLDTPGHEAFTAMRSRSAHVTDIVVLVVAADEGIMPQTEEAIDHARAADVPIVIALNKIDKPNADPDRVKKQLAEKDLGAEDWGGKTIVVGVSAITGDGVDELLESILLEAEILELKANAQKQASGIVVEAHLSQGKGAVISLIVQSGTLNEGDYLIVGPYYGKVRAMHDDHGRTVKAAGPSMPVEFLGLSDVPEAGESFYVVDNEKQAREISLRRLEQANNTRLHAHQKVTLEDLYSQIQEGEVKELNVIIKADVQGSLEALKDSLSKIPSNKVKIKFIHCGVGDVNASDVLLAVASKAIIIAFHVGIGPRAKEALEKDPVDVREYRIIYDAVDDIRNALEGLLDAKIQKNFQSRVEIREVFKLSKSGLIAGCYVTKGKVTRKANVDIKRDNEVIFTGKISSLKRFKDDVKDVTEGMECGIAIEGFDKYQAGDIIEAYEIESIAQKL